MDTEVGHIARLLETASSDETPLRRLDQVGRRLLWACLGIVAGLFPGPAPRAPFELFLSAVSLAVAAIPEGLPAVVTIALALGAQRMVRACAGAAPAGSGNAGVRPGHLQGQDRHPDRRRNDGAQSGHGSTAFAVSGEGYATTGAFFADGVNRCRRAAPLVDSSLRAAAACNDAELRRQTAPGGRRSDRGRSWLRRPRGGSARAFEAEIPACGDPPFDSDRKCMTVIGHGRALLAFVKGAPEVILNVAPHPDQPGVQALADSDRARMLQASAPHGPRCAPRAGPGGAATRRLADNHRGDRAN